MNTYIIFKGFEITYINKDSLDDARQFAIMYCDHSQEIIVREFKNIRNLTKKN